MRTRTTIKEIGTNSGFLEKATVRFVPGLNCIIGARGTCKSTIVESIRFAFGLDPGRVQELVAQNGMITKTLGAGSVRCVLEAQEDGQTAQYTIDREVDGAPRVLRNGARDVLGDDILQDIEIYSQGALQQIASADKPQLRLHLIDRPNRAEILRLGREVEKRVLELKTLGSRLRVIRGDIDKSRLEVRDLEQLRAELGRTVENRPELPPTLEEQHLLYVERQRVIEMLNDLLLLQRKSISDLAVGISAHEKLDALRANLHAVSKIDRHPASDLIDQVERIIATVADKRDQLAKVPVAEETEKLTSQFERENETYYQLRQQQQNLSESLKREDVVRRRVSELEKVERELRQLETERNELLQRRRTLRAEVAEMRDSIFEMRVQESERINQEFGDVILLSVRRATHSKPFVSKLSELLAGSRIRTQGNIAEELVTTLSPSDLLQTIEEGDAQRLATLLSRDLGQITRVITYLRDHPDLYQIEGELFEDSLEITMFDNGQPKPVEELSEGQRATALLPLILRNSSCPLIVDQPEDDLDNSFIYRVLVKNILKLKSQRQLVFVTHNANIPVLGDADEIVVMHMDKPTKAGPPRCGSLEDRKEDILHLLEGGKEAFEHREQRYRPLLK